MSSSVSNRIPEAGLSRRSHQRIKFWCVSTQSIYLELSCAPQLPANETMSEKEIPALKDSEGNGFAAVMRKDSKFPDEGVVDMVEMNQLNDAELARNLKVHMNCEYQD